MKRLVLLIAALVVATPLFAAETKEDLCKLNLQKLRDLRQTPVMGQPLLGQIQSDRKDAETAQKAKDYDKCVNLTNRALANVLKGSNTN